MCQQQKITSISGFDLITGTTISTSAMNEGLLPNSNPQNDLVKGIKTETVSPEPLALVTILLVILGLLMSFYEKISDISSAIVSFIGGLTLVFLSTVVPDNILGKVHYPPITVEGAAGYYLALALFIILFVYNSYLISHRIENKPEDLHSFITTMRVCPHCGIRNDLSSIYCNSCGGKMEEFIY
jgi:hypothetical protein